MMGNGKFYALSGGLPPSDIFQFTEATFKMKYDALFIFQYNSNATKVTINRKFIFVRDGSELKLDKNMMDIAQQYGMSEG